MITDSDRVDASRTYEHRVAAGRVGAEEVEVRPETSRSETNTV